jgi:hypothetical protein
MLKVGNYKQTYYRCRKQYERMKVEQVRIGQVIRASGRDYQFSGAALALNFIKLKMS